MDLQQFVTSFESAVDGIEPGSLTPTTAFRSEIEVWDSLAALSVLAMIDAEYDISIKANDFIACVTIQDVFNLVVAAV
jgi:acyl carrier protein